MSNIEPEAPPNFLAIARQHLDSVQAIHNAVVEQLGGGAFVGPVQRKKLTLMAATPDKFIAAVAVTLEENPKLASLSPRTAAEMRRAVAVTAALTEIANRYELLARGCRDTVAVRRAEVAQDAMRAYGVCKSANRVADGEELVPAVQGMKAALGRTGRSGKSRKAKLAAGSPVVVAPALIAPAAGAPAVVATGGGK